MAAQASLTDRLLESLRRLSPSAARSSTSEGRAVERHKRIAWTAGAAVTAKLVSVGTALISVPLTLHYLGPERFGMWMTIASIIAMLSFADFGIANGVLNVVSTAYGKDDQSGIRRAIASGFYLLLAVAAGLLGLFALVYPFVSWAGLFNVKDALAVAEAGPALAVFVGCFACHIPLAVVQRAQMGMQQGFMVSLWQCLGSVISLIGVLVVIKLQLGLPWLVLALAGGPVVACAFNTADFLFRVGPQFRPRLRDISKETSRKVVVTGFVFFALQLVAAIAYTSDNIVIAQLLGASAVADYAVLEKLFSLVSVALAMLLAPLWPAYGEAIARADGVWVRTTLIRSLWLGLGLATLLALFIVLFSDVIMRLWINDAVTPPSLLLAAFAAWKIVEGGGMALAMFLNGALVIRWQLLCAIPTALAAIALKLTLVPMVGVSGAIWASVVAYLVFTAIPMAVYVPRLLRRLDTLALPP